MTRKSRADTPSSETHPKGEAHWNAKLTERAVLQIRWACEEGVNESALARRFGVSPSVICAIKKGRAWKHLT